jgi:peptidoglycan-associated lipoprotein
MKRYFTLTGIIVVMVFCTLFLMTGCAKKPVVQETETAKEKVATTELSPADRDRREATLDDQAVKVEESLLQEKLLADKIAQAIKESFSDIHFDFDKYSLSSEARDRLKGQSAWLKKNKDYKLVIEGHCDERGTTEYNLALGERRAHEAMKYLVELGVDAKRMRTVSYGKEKPLDPGHNEEAWAKNRRAHFIVTPMK